MEKIFINHHVVFDEHIFTFTSFISNSTASTKFDLVNIPPTLFSVPYLTYSSSSLTSSDTLDSNSLQQNNVSDNSSESSPSNFVTSSQHAIQLVSFLALSQYLTHNQSFILWSLGLSLVYLNLRSYLQIWSMMNLRMLLRLSTAPIGKLRWIMNIIFS